MRPARALLFLLILAVAPLRGALCGALCGSLSSAACGSEHSAAGTGCHGSHPASEPSRGTAPCVNDGDAQEASIRATFGLELPFAGPVFALESSNSIVGATRETLRPSGESLRFSRAASPFDVLRV
jgi:hypothetical protein